MKVVLIASMLPMICGLQATEMVYPDSISTEDVFAAQVQSDGNVAGVNHSTNNLFTPQQWLYPLMVYGQIAGG